MLSVRKVLAVLALGMLALSASSVEAARVHHHRSAAVAQSAQAAQTTRPQVAARLVLEDEFQMEFTKFMKAHSKEYTVDDLFIRYGIFKDNYQFMVQHNAEADAGVHSHRVGVSWLADLTNDEYRSMLLTYNSELSGPAPSMEEWEQVQPESWNVSSANIPGSIDWRQKGRVGPVKNQGSCGACWAFSATAAMENNNGGQSLSEQQLIDCVGNGCNGCNGGNANTAMEYVKSAGGIASGGAYPFTGRKGSCRGVVGGAKGRVSSVTHLPANEGAIVNAVANHGVVAVALDGAAPDFQHYQTGVFDGACSTTRNHAVAIVGYGNQSGKDTWIVKNSWGNWGQGGYMIMRRGVNKCGVAGDASFAN